MFWGLVDLCDYDITMDHGYYLLAIEYLFISHTVELHHLLVCCKLSHFASAYTRMSPTLFPPYKKHHDLVELIL